MKNTNSTYDNLTMQEIRTLLDKKVEAWNLADDISEKINLEVEMADLTQRYNELSMLSVYAKCLADEQPSVAFIKAYYYPVISTKKTQCKDIEDGKSKSYYVYSVKETDNKGNRLVKNLELVKFLDWTADRNKLAAYAKDWKSKTNAARRVINGECEKQVNSKDGYKISKTKIKTALQAMFDSLVFIPSETGKNAVVASGTIAGLIVHLAADLKEEYNDGSPDFTPEFLRDKKWYKLVMQFLNIAVTGKTLKPVYGEPEDPAKAKAKAKAKADAPATEAAK